MNKTKAIAMGTVGLVGLVLGGSPAYALDCRNIELISAWGAGGGTDTFLRQIAEPLSDILETPVKVINIEGAMGEVARQELVSRPADGCSLVSIDPDTLTTEIQGQTEISIIEDMIPVFRGHVDIGLLHAKGDGEIKSWEDLVAWAKEHPGELNMGGTGAVGADRTAIETTLAEAGVIEFNYIPYDSAGAMHADLLGGRLHGMYDEMSSVGAMVEAGQIEPLIVINDKRLEVLPEVPAAGELGYEVAPSNWRGLAAKAGTPGDVMTDLSNALLEASEAESYKEYESSRLLDLKADGKLGTEAFQEVIAEEYKTKQETLAKQQ